MPQSYVKTLIIRVLCVPVYVWVKEVLGGLSSAGIVICLDTSQLQQHSIYIRYSVSSGLFIIFVLENKSWAINQFLLGSFLAILLLLVLVWIDFGFILKLGMAFHYFS